MENLLASSMIHMFLGRGMAAVPEMLPPKRLLLACSGSGPALPEIAKEMASGMGRNNCRTRVARLCRGDGPNAISPSEYDGIIVGISPEGTGNTQEAFSFIRRHLTDMSTRVVALFFLLEPGMEPWSARTLPRDLAGLSWLDVRNFDLGSPGLRTNAGNWALNTVWPLMETGWLADMIFPEPVPLSQETAPVPV